MILIPRTVSRSIKKEIGGERFTENGLIEKIDSNPKLLIPFFIQACQSQSFCTHNKNFVRKLFSLIFKKIIHDEIPYDDSKKSCAYFMRYNLKAFRLATVTPENRSYSGVSMLLAVPKIVSLMREIELGGKKTLVQHVNLDEFKVLYSTFPLHDFSIFNNLPSDSLKSCLLQCREWDYQKGMIEIQKVFILRIHNIVDAFEMYGFSRINRFPLIRSYCDNVIQNWEWAASMLQGAQVYFTHRAGCLLPFRDPIPFAYTELSKHNFSIEKFCKFVPDAIYERLDIGIVAKGMLAISFKRVNPLHYLNFLQTGKKQEAVNFHDVENVTFDRGSLLSDDFIVGFCAFFPNIREISFKEGKSFNKDFFRHLGLILPKLKSFVIYEVELLDKAFFESISDAFSQLEELTFACIKQLDSFDFIHFPRLRRLVIEQCSEVKGENLNRFSNLLELKLQAINWKNVQKLVKACPEIAVLTLRDVEGFSLEMYPHPYSIVEIIIDRDLLLNSQEGDALHVLDRFSKLKRLEIVGIPCDFLVKLLEPFRFKFEIKIVDLAC